MRSFVFVSLAVLEELKLTHKQTELPFIYQITKITSRSPFDLCAVAHLWAMARRLKTTGIKRAVLEIRNNT